MKKVIVYLSSIFLIIPTAFPYICVPHPASGPCLTNTENPTQSFTLIAGDPNSAATFVLNSLNFERADLQTVPTELNIETVNTYQEARFIKETNKNCGKWTTCTVYKLTAKANAAPGDYTIIAHAEGTSECNGSHYSCDDIKHNVKIIKK